MICQDMKGIVLQMNIEDNEFLNQVDQGYVGLASPRVQVHKLEDDTPTWVIRKFEHIARVEGISYYDFVAKYNPSFEPRDWDDGAESGFEAYA